MQYCVCVRRGMCGLEFSLPQRIPTPTTAWTLLCSKMLRNIENVEAAKNGGNDTKGLHHLPPSLFCNIPDFTYVFIDMWLHAKQSPVADPRRWFRAFIHM